MLLGKIASKTERRQRAADAYRKALKLNPFLWSCFENLCNLGEKPNPSQIFQFNDLENMSYCHGSSFNNVESVIISNNTPCQDGQLYITPQQIAANGNTPVYNSGINSKLCTPDDSPALKPMSGMELLSGIKMIPVRFRFDSMVSSI